MEQWYDQATSKLISRPYYSKVAKLVQSAEYAESVFLGKCKEKLDARFPRDCSNLHKAAGAAPFVVVVGSGRVAQLLLKEAILPSRIRVKVLSLGADTVHTEQIAALGATTTTDCNTLLTAELIFLCAPAIDLVGVEAHITKFGIGDKVVRFESK